MFDVTQHDSTRLHWAHLDRFLLVGSEGGTRFVGAGRVTRDSAVDVAACLAEDGPRVVQRVVEASRTGRAPRKEPALFVLAMAAVSDDSITRAAAFAALPEVASTAMHLTRWRQYVRTLD